MLDIGYYIKEVLKYEESVIIQGLGSFVTRYKPAEIKSRTGSIAPPTKEVYFEEKVKEDNGRLVNFICENENITADLVRKGIEQFVSEVIIKLNQGEHVRINDLGYLYKDKAYKIQFVREASENILLDTFGLQEIEWDISREKSVPENKPVKPEAAQKRKVLIIPIVILLVIILVFTILISENVNTKGGKGFLSGTFSEKKDSGGHKPVPGEANNSYNELDSLNEKKNALMYEENKYAGYNRFYLIAGSFSIYNNAEQYKYELDARGFPAEVLDVDGKIFRVSMKSYAGRHEALIDLKQYQDQFQDQTLWILNVKK